ncbi:fatty acid desaturase [Methylocapsa acidiphila]|uniref:fatty acid desaturase n=1 Tax=Methylocapsa acidiphila TaxID=133552 RepID=UPI000415BFA3|nr:fatty acid desaturase [Methylocapsa acidiphila]
MPIIEWPTIGLAAVIYGGWLAATYFQSQLPVWLLAPMGAWLVAWHSSLQHELLHGHPTPWRGVNRALGFAPLAFWLPYDVYHSTHLAHHKDDALTDPRQDPESRYWTCEDWSRLGPLARFAVRAQSTLVGRLALGPIWVPMGLFIGELRAARSHPRRSVEVWFPHLLACTVTFFWIVAVCRMSIWLYLFAIVYPANALSLLRSFAEHRVANKIAERTAIVENARLLGALFLFNNLHVVHHDHPALPWYRIPGWYRDHRVLILQKNGGLVYNGYFEVARRYAFMWRRDPIHPFSP